RNTNPRSFYQTNGRHFRRSLLSTRHFTADQTGSANRRECGKEAAPRLYRLHNSALFLFTVGPLRGHFHQKDSTPRCGASAAIHWGARQSAKGRVAADAVPECL